MRQNRGLPPQNARAAATAAAPSQEVTSPCDGCYPSAAGGPGAESPRPPSPAEQAPCSTGSHEKYTRLRGSLVFNSLKKKSQCPPPATHSGGKCLKHLQGTQYILEIFPKRAHPETLVPRKLCRKGRGVGVGSNYVHWSHHVH